MREPLEVLESHLKLREEKKLEEDIQENYSPEITIISNQGVFQGSEGVRESAKILEEYLPNAKFTYEIKQVKGDIAYLVWSGQTESKLVRGTDTFLIKDEQIIIQTIFY